MSLILKPRSVIYDADVYLKISPSDAGFDSAEAIT